MTPAQIQAEIDQINSVLASGTKSASSDGETVSFDFDELRRRRAELQASQYRQRHRNRRVRTIGLHNAF